MTSRSPLSSQRAIALWLFVVAALVFAMVVLGGVTRLTRSGLSIVEWQPLIGTLPPLNDADWQVLFEKYRQTPEYLKVNTGMDIEGFKGIFWLEYFHRLLGRLIGVAFLVPFLYFLVRRRIDRALTPKLIVMFALGAAQGLMGWLMVASGLVDVPRVSPYRLTAHLGLAVIIYMYIVWTALGLLAPRPAAETVPPRLRRASGALVGAIFVMILSGGFVAGTHAGFVFNTFPTMGGQWIPAGLFSMSPWWINFFENLATVQFDHRILAYLITLAVVALWVFAQRAMISARARLYAHLLLAALVLQVGLGIAALLTVVAVPVAAAHQAGAMLLFTMALLFAHSLRRQR